MSGELGDKSGAEDGIVRGLGWRIGGAGRGDTPFPRVVQLPAETIANLVYVEFEPIEGGASAVTLGSSATCAISGSVPGPSPVASLAMDPPLVPGVPVKPDSPQVIHCASTSKAPGEIPMSSSIFAPGFFATPIKLGEKQAPTGAPAPL